MSIEEIAGRMGKNTAQLFSELMAETESNVAQLNVLSPIPETVFRGGVEDFSLEREGVKLIVKRTRPTAILLVRIEAGDMNTIPKTDKLEIELLQSSYWMNGRKFQSTKETALFFVGLVSGV